MNEEKRQMRICMISALKAAAQLTSAMIDAALELLKSELREREGE
jgi:hypothetical protein